MPGFSGPSKIQVDSTAFVVPSITVFGRNGQTVMVTDQSRRFRLGEISEEWIIQSLWHASSPIIVETGLIAEGSFPLLLAT